MITAETLKASWVLEKTSDAYKNWAKGWKNEADALDAFWNHRTTPTITFESKYGIAKMEEAWAYWAVVDQPRIYYSPIGVGLLNYIIKTPAAHLRGWHDWPACDIRTARGVELYAPTKGKVPNFYKNDFHDGTGAKFVFEFPVEDRLILMYFAGVEHPLGVSAHFAENQVMGYASSDVLEIGCSSAEQLYKFLYSAGVQ